MAIVRWEPARDLASMEIDRLHSMFDNLFDARFTRGWTPAVDIYETDAHEVVLKAELPEMKRDDISITYGAFSRSFTIPSTIDASRISASYKDGVLTVRLPQREETKPKQIAVTE